MHSGFTRFWALLLLIALLGGAGGCAGTEQAGGDGTIVVALESDILTLDPAMHRDRVTETVIRNMFDGLVTRTTDMKVVPELAESWEAVTPTEYNFKLREDVKFHNGDPMTADDVVFTFERLLTEGAINGQTSPRVGLLGPLRSVEKTGDYEVKFVFSEPWSLFLTMLPHQQIVPKKYIEENGETYFAANPVGTGPFMFEGGDINEQIVLKRFDDYYGGSPDIRPVGPAQVAQVIFRVVPEANTRLALLLTGEAHIVTNLPPHMAEEAAGNPEAVVKTTNGTNVHYVSLNVTQPPLDDHRVREAIALAIGTEEIVQGIYGDYGVPMTGPLLPGGFGKNTELQKIERDIEAAKALLADAGYADGFSLVIDTEDSMKDDADAVAAHLRDAGIDASVRTWEWGVLKPLLLDGSRSVLLNYYGNASMDPYDLLDPVFKTGGRGNYSHYSNPDLDALLEEAAVEIDPAERGRMYQEAEKVIHDEHVWVMTYTRKVIEACSAKISNWEPSPDGRINLHDVQIKE